MKTGVCIWYKFWKVHPSAMACRLPREEGFVANQIKWLAISLIANGLHIQRLKTNIGKTLLLCNSAVGEHATFSSWWKRTITLPRNSCLFSMISFGSDSSTLLRTFHHPQSIYFFILWLQISRTLLPFNRISHESFSMWSSEQDGTWNEIHNAKRFRDITCSVHAQRPLVAARDGSAVKSKPTTCSFEMGVWWRHPTHPTKNWEKFATSPNRTARKQKKNRHHKCPQRNYRTHYFGLITCWAAQNADFLPTPVHSACCWWRSPNSPIPVLFRPAGATGCRSPVNGTSTHACKAWLLTSGNKACDEVSIKQSIMLGSSNFQQ